MRPKSDLEARHRGKQVLAGEWLLHQRRIAVRRRQMFAAIAADKREGNTARDQRIGDAACGLAREVRIEERAVDRLTGEGLERIGNIPGWANHG